MCVVPGDYEVQNENEPNEGEVAANISARLEELAFQIDVAISEIREYIQVERQELLIMIVADLSTYSSPIRLGDALVYGANPSPLRPVEYLQSLISAKEAENSAVATDAELEALAHRYLRDCEALYELTQEYLITWAAAHIDDADVLTVVEAQLTQAVRGNRYEFLQSDYFRPLLAAHDDEFRKLFSMSSDEVLGGLENLLSAIGHGRLAAFNELGELFDRGVMSESFELPLDDPSLFEKASTACLEAFTVQHFDVMRITGWPAEFIDGLSFRPGEGVFFERGRMAYWPIAALPIQRRPFITLNGATYCFDYYMLTDHFYRSVQKLLLSEDPDYEESWQERQKDASESMVENVFKRLLPGCSTFVNNYYGMKGRDGENDLLVIFHDSVVIVEIKAGQFTVVPPLSDFRAHVARYRDLIQKPNNQCARMREYVENANGELVLYGADGAVKETLDVSGISKVYCISVTIENINTFASRAEKLGFLQLEQGVACVAVDDLMTYAEYFENPLVFLHFLAQREAASTRSKLFVNDELDHLGLYISHNCYAMEVDRADESDIVVAAGYRKELDAYFETLGNPVPTPPKPRQDMPLRFMEIIDVLCSEGVVNCVAASGWLLDFSSEARRQLAAGIDQALERQNETRRQLAISFSGREGSIQLTTFVLQKGLTAPFTVQDMRDYTASLMLAHGQESRAVLMLSYDERLRLIKVEFEMLFPDDIPSESEAGLKRRGEDLCSAIVERYRIAHGKIGRNEQCPCGSGRKYKRCHGRG